MRKFTFYPLIVSLLLLQSCHTFYKVQNVQYSNYKIQPSTDESNPISSVIRPYSDSVRKLMDDVIGYNEVQLERKRQNNTLGFFMSDAYLHMAKQKVDPNVDAAFMNAGGVRLPDLPAGPVTRSKIFELMPFDNLMVLLKIKGVLLKRYLDTLAATEGVVASGISLQIENGTTQQVLVNGKPLEPERDYTIIHSDYSVMNSSLLKSIDRTTKDYLLRDAIIDYVRLTNADGKKITVPNPERISYVK